MPRRRIVFLKDLAADLRASTRRRPQHPGPPEEQRATEELGRRLDETRARLKRESPPREPDDR